MTAGDQAPPPADTGSVKDRVPASRRSIAGDGVGAAHWGRRLAELAERHQVPGAVIGILRVTDPADSTRDELTEAACGVLNTATGVSTTADSLFQIGSVSKVWTATVVMELVDEGMLQLDLPDPARVLVDLAVAVGDGGRTLSDVAVLGDQGALFGPVTSDSTCWGLLDGLEGGELAGIERARAGAHEVVWAQHAETRGAAFPPARAAGTQVAGIVLDVNASLVVCNSDKEQAAPTFKRGYGHHPVRREALLIRAGVRDRRHQPCRSRAVKLRTA